MNAFDPSRVNVVQVDAEVSLYCHVRVVTLPVDESVNVTFNGAVPVVGYPRTRNRGYRSGIDRDVTGDSLGIGSARSADRQLDVIQYRAFEKVNAFDPSRVNVVQVDADGEFVLPCPVW